MGSASVLLSTVKVALTEIQAEALRDKNKGILFTWGPDAQSYSAHIDIAPRTMGETV
jgi:hypothetical protein